MKIAIFSCSNIVHTTKIYTTANPAVIFLTRTQVIKMILPHLQKQLKSENWRMREAAILAIGAMATGCIDGGTCGCSVQIYMSSSGRAFSCGR